MAIFVVCPGCRTRFTVSDQFAGRSGPCPKCKTVIQIPKLNEQVVIEEPEQFADGGRGISGRLTTKPLARVERMFKPVHAAIVVGGLAVVFFVTLVLGRLDVFRERAWLQAIGLAAVTIPVAAVGYEALRHPDDLQPLRGRDLAIRSAVCAIGYVIIWAGFHWLISNFVTEELWTWAIVLPPVFAAGGFVAYAAMELDYSIGILHFIFFAIIALALRWAAGLGWIWNLPQPVYPT